MSDLKKLVENEDHLSLSQVENKDYQAIAHIHLEHYEKALSLTEKGTFEHCYCLYKLKKYSKCVKQLNKIPEKDDKHNILLAQALYNLRHYTKALEIVSKYKNSTALINAEAIVSFIEAAKNTKNIQKYSINCKDKCYEYEQANYDFAEDERLEFEFNKTFAKMCDEDAFVKELEEKIDNVYCRNQLNNVTGNYEEMDTSYLTRRQKEIIVYNQEGGVIGNGMHFQKDNKEYEYFRNNKKESSALIEDYKKIKKWDESRKRRKNKEFKVEKINDEELREMMEVLTRKNMSQEELKEIIQKYKE